MQQTSHGQNGGSLLISVLGRQYLSVRLVLLVTLALIGCDTLIANRLIIGTPANRQEADSSIGELMSVAHEALRSCGVKEEHLSSDEDTWLWRNPDRPPGLVVDIRTGWEVSLSQAPYGAIGPTETYLCVKKALQGKLQARFGKERIRVE
jgi:hypothetical protein